MKSTGIIGSTALAETIVKRLFSTARCEAHKERKKNQKKKERGSLWKLPHLWKSIKMASSATSA
jgi:hypothetical protein